MGIKITILILEIKIITMVKIRHINSYNGKNKALLLPIMVKYILH